MESIVVVGLGNPGPDYETTRHNVGFRVVDRLSGRWKKRFTIDADDIALATGDLRGRRILLVKPLTFMNNSGVAVAEALRRFDVAVSSLLIVVDDFALPLGAIRLRSGGSDGGHNGLASVIEHLHTEEFPRLRCGVGIENPPPGEAMAEYVLSPFDAGEEELVTAMIERAADAATEFAISGISSAMNRFNT